MASVPAAANKLPLLSSSPSSFPSGTQQQRWWCPPIAAPPCPALRDAQALLGASMRRHRVRAHANPRQNARMYEKYEANRRAFGGEAFDSTEADARTLRQLRRLLGEDLHDASATAADPGPMLVDARRVAAMAEFYRTLPDEADDPAYAATMTMTTKKRRGGGGGSPLLLASPPPLPPRSLPDCLSARDPPAAAELDARVRIGLDGGISGVRDAVVRPLLDDNDDAEEDGSRWRRRAAQALRQQQPSFSSAFSSSSSVSTSAFVLWDVESAPLPPDADPRAAARLLEALAEEVANSGRASASTPAPAPVRLSVFGTRPALARIPAAFASRYAVEGASTSRLASNADTAAAATSLGGRCAAYYCSRGLLFAPAKGAQPSLKYALRREGAEVVQVGEAVVVRQKKSGGGKKKQKQKESVAQAQRAQAPADALADAAERLLRAHAAARARELFEEGEDTHPRALLLVVVAGAGELEATGLRRRLARGDGSEEDGGGGGVVPLLVVSGGGGGGEDDTSTEISWEALLRE